MKHFKRIFNKLTNQETGADRPPDSIFKKGMEYSHHHLIAFVLVFGFLGTAAIWQGFGAPAPVIATMEAENMILPRGATLVQAEDASAGKAVKMVVNGTLTATGLVDSEAASLTIRAYGQNCGGVWPRMIVAIDDTIVNSVTVDSGSWKDFSKALTVSRGSHKLSITYISPATAVVGAATSVPDSTCTGAMFVDKAVFHGPADDTPPPPPPPAPVAPTLNFSASPASITSGQSSTLTWTTTNADVCIASGAWSGTKAVAGSESTGSLTATQSYTLNCSGSGGSIERAVTVTVTATPTPPPSPPPPSPPPPSPPPPTSGVCLVSNRGSWALGGQSCNYGTLITRTNATFACTQPLSAYGTLPIKVVVVSTTAWDAAGAVTVDNGCRGDGNDDTIDLIVDIQGNGPKSSTGPGQDSFKTRQGQGPRDIQLTGRMECGRQAPAAHQDFVQFQGGTNIAIVNATSGNYSAGLSTCQGAGGMIFSSSVVNIDILGGEYIACNHGILGGSPSSNPGGEVRDAKFRSGRNDGTDPNCNYASSNPCQTSLPMTNVTCQRWNVSTKTWNNQ